MQYTALPHEVIESGGLRNWDIVAVLCHKMTSTSAKRTRDLFQPAKVPLELVSQFAPAGDQPGAIAALSAGIESGKPFQTLLGVTGSGKTFTIANVLAKFNRPALIIAPNKTLAAQLYQEFKDFFPHNRVRYFVSYYDYYQPEAYVPSTDTYIEKDSAINEEIDMMRHSATRSVLEGTDSIIVASVSCIYGLGAPDEYFAMMLFVEEGQKVSREEVINQLVTMQYKRADLEFTRGTFRVRGETIDILPSDEDAQAVRLNFYGDEIEEIRIIDMLSGATIHKAPSAAIYPVSHYVTSQENVKKAIERISAELEVQLKSLMAQGKLLEAQRLEQRTKYDLELLKEIGFCPGIENYSRHLAGRAAGEPPTTLIDYFPDDYILVIDESHVTVPQIGGMYRGDRSRKQTLVDFGFRLSSALDNRPLNAEEFWQRAGQTIFVSATPAALEIERSGINVVQQINRPTGLIDPLVDIRPAKDQVDDLLAEIKETVAAGDRVLVTTLTKSMAERLSQYLQEIGVKARYLHSDIDTIERVEILRGLRKGEFDVLIGINLLREGLDLVEVALVAILDGDKEGFLRSKTSLIQTMGRAARNIKGRVIIYADVMTDSIRGAVAEAERRREIQLAFNAKHGITPTSAKRSIPEGLIPGERLLTVLAAGDDKVIEVPREPAAQRALVDQLRKQMFEAAARREFEKAAELRDSLKRLQEALLVS